MWVYMAFPLNCPLSLLLTPTNKQTVVAMIFFLKSNTVFLSFCRRCRRQYGWNSEG